MLPVIGAVFGVYVKMNTQVEKMKGRIYSLESDRTELKGLVKECVEGINDLKVLLAKKGI